MELKIVFLVLASLSGVLSSSYNQSEDSEVKRLSRKKRFLLFPPGANILLTSSFGKGLVFRGPAGYVAIGELDLYYPLPDYKYHASALKLGKIAMYPPEPKKPKPPPPPTTKAPEKEDHHHHDGGELTPEEVKTYLKDHPGTYVPPGWGKDRADWNTNNQQYQSGYWAQDRMQNPYGYQYPSNTLNHYLGGYKDGSSSYFGWSERPYDIYRRSLLKQTFDDEDTEEHERSKWLSGESFNISHHSSWEDFHHYRDRRALFSHLEDSIGSITGFHMKECILRSICEAKNMLPPPGRSMAMDIFRVLFSVPLNEALTDDYSNAMREESLDCRARYGNGCPMSLLDLILFGKFET
ncbi:uncharacterized protein LOC118504512 [Anopheles stephensi]|uniref:uncharacterized protein LOC118504512 n=1 Tax=Anopheles stephensi TaxID=30069 RepID=UPI001658985A|nr:uncharacterized protein LOC118504512 [Anopheles stephensi]